MGRGDDEMTSSLDGFFEGRIERRGENRGSAGILLKATAATGRERRRNVRFIVFMVVFFAFDTNNKYMRAKASAISQ